MVRENPNKFQQFCISRGYTATDVAERLGKSKHTIYSYYSGERLPNRATMKLMEEKLGIDPKEYF